MKKSFIKIVYCYILVVICFALYLRFFHENLINHFYNIYFPEIQAQYVQEIGKYEGISIQKSIDVELPENVVFEIESIIDQLPSSLKAHKPEKILFLGEKYITNKNVLKILQGSGGFASENITISTNTISLLNSDSTLGYAWLREVLFHEWMHVIQNDVEQKNSILIDFFNDVVFINNSSSFREDFFIDYATRSGWNSVNFFDLKFITNQGENNTQMQSNYGKTNMIEDQAETLRLALIGQYQILSPQRVEWLEQNFDINKYQFAKYTLPSWLMEPGNIVGYADKQGILNAIKALKSPIVNKRYQEYFDENKYVIYSLWNLKDTDQNNTVDYYDQEMQKRNFFITFKDNNVCVPDCSYKLYAREYSSFNNKYFILTDPGQKMIILQGTDRHENIYRLNIPKNEKIY